MKFEYLQCHRMTFEYLKCHRIESYPNSAINILLSRLTVEAIHRIPADAVGYEHSPGLLYLERLLNARAMSNILWVRRLASPTRMVLSLCAILPHHPHLTCVQRSGTRFVVWIFHVLELKHNIRAPGYAPASTYRRNRALRFELCDEGIFQGRSQHNGCIPISILVSAGVWKLVRQGLNTCMPFLAVASLFAIATLEHFAHRFCRVDGIVKLTGQHWCQQNKSTRPKAAELLGEG